MVTTFINLRYYIRTKITSTYCLTCMKKKIKIFKRILKKSLIYIDLYLFHCISFQNFIKYTKCIILARYYFLAITHAINCKIRPRTILGPIFKNITCDFCFYYIIFTHSAKLNFYICSSKDYIMK